MRRMSIKNLFKPSDSGRYRKLVIILFIVVLAGIIYLGYPLVFPDSSVKSPATPAKKIITPSSTVVATKIETKSEVKEKTEFEIEMEKRKQSYEDKIFVYEPYEPPGNRNPFQKVSTSYFLEETAEKEEVEGKEGGALKFLKPELPPGTKLTGIIGSKDNKVAIIVTNEETFIANLYDIISERYIVKEIKKDEVIIDFNEYLFSLKIGGEEASNE